VQPNGLADGPFGSNLKTEHYAPSGARVIRLQNIGRGAFLDANRAFIELAHFERLRRHEAVAGDVVVASLGDGVRPRGTGVRGPGAHRPCGRQG
jgi:type I restriction enzyme S subunit